MLDTTILIAQVQPPADKGQPADQPGFPWPLFALIAVMFYFVVFLPGRKERQKRTELLGALKKDDEVVTSGGILGRVASIKDDEVTLKSDESRIRVLKSSIARIVNPKVEPPKEEPKA